VSVALEKSFIMSTKRPNFLRTDKNFNFVDFSNRAVDIWLKFVSLYHAKSTDNLYFSFKNSWQAEFRVYEVNPWHPPYTKQKQTDSWKHLPGMPA